MTQKNFPNVDNATRIQPQQQIPAKRQKKKKRVTGK